MDRLAERAPVIAPDADGAAYRARGAARARAAGHVDAGSRRGGRRAADALRARPVHHAVRVRRRRDTGQHQRRRVRRNAPGADGARRRQGERGGHEARRRRHVGAARPVRHCLAGGGWLWPRRGGRGRRPWAGAAASGALPASGGAPAVRQAGAAVRHAPAGGHPVPAAARELAATARYGDRGHRRSRRQRLARPCRRGDQADPASRGRCRERDGPGVRAGGDDAVCGQRAARHRPARRRRSICRWSAT